jgi:large subunit ribosomal protein L13
MKYIAKPQDIERKWYIVDAAGKPLGRVASQVASILRGKNKPIFTPNSSVSFHTRMIVL